MTHRIGITSFQCVLYVVSAQKYILPTTYNVSERNEVKYAEDVHCQCFFLPVQKIIRVPY